MFYERDRGLLGYPKGQALERIPEENTMFLVSAFSSLEGSGSPWWLVGDVEINLGSFNRSGKYLTLSDILGPRARGNCFN